jgi:hypothetical protein
VASGVHILDGDPERHLGDLGLRRVRVLREFVPDPV